jgi:DNA-binding LytR/AlgR family response regulator
LERCLRKFSVKSGFETELKSFERGAAGAAALEGIVRASTADAILVVTDYECPSAEDGEAMIETAKRMRGSNPRLAITVMSGSTRGKNAAAREGLDFVEKPFDSSMIEAIFQRIASLSAAA